MSKIPKIPVQIERRYGLPMKPFFGGPQKIRDLTVVCSYSVADVHGLNFYISITNLKSKLSSNIFFKP